MQAQISNIERGRISVIFYRLFRYPSCFGVFYVNINFKTPAGLKVRLNHRYFFYQLTNADKPCTDEEMVYNDTMYGAVKNIESRFVVPAALLQTFCLFAVIFHMNTFVFCSVSILLYIFGCIWRCLKQDFLLSTLFSFLSLLYIKLWWLCYLAMLILSFVLKSTYLIIPYIAVRIVLCIFVFLQNNLILSESKKKYGTAFNDVELCAFRVFHAASKSNESFSDYIKQYYADTQ